MIGLDVERIWGGDGREGGKIEIGIMMADFSSSRGITQCIKQKRNGFQVATSDLAVWRSLYRTKGSWEKWSNLLTFTIKVISSKFPINVSKEPCQSSYQPLTPI